MLWAEQRRSAPGSQYQRASVDPVSSYATLQECAAKLDTLQSAGDQRWGPAMLYRVVGDPKVEVPRPSSRAALRTGEVGRPNPGPWS